MEGGSRVWINSAPCLAAIVGGSGAGKSHLARLLKEVLGKHATILSLDDFYKDRSLCPPKRRSQINFDHPRAIDWKTFRSVLEQLSRNQTALAPRYDFKTHRRLSFPRLIKPRPVILVEGLWLLHRPSLRRLFHLKVFVACPARTRLRRRIERDGNERSRTAASIRRQFFKTVAPMHRIHVVPQVGWADLVVRSELTREDVWRLAESLRIRRGSESLVSRALLPGNIERHTQSKIKPFRRVL